MNTKNITVAFHIGRGGRFNNGGHKTFNPYVKRIQDCYTDKVVLNNLDDNDNVLPDEEWTLTDCSGNVLIKGREAIDNEPTGILELDGEYNTDIVRYIEDCDDEEIRLIYKAYTDGEVLDCDMVGYVCERLGLYRISNVKFYQTNATIFFTDGTSLEYMWDGMEDVTEEEIKELLEENDIDAVSIERYASDFVEHFYSN